MTIYCGYIRLLRPIHGFVRILPIISLLCCIGQHIDYIICIFNHEKLIFINLRKCQYYVASWQGHRRQGRPPRHSNLSLRQLSYKTKKYKSDQQLQRPQRLSKQTLPLYYISIDWCKYRNEPQRTQWSSIRLQLRLSCFLFPCSGKTKRCLEL